MRDAGVPQDKLDSFDYNEKLFFIQQSGEDLKYEGSSSTEYSRDLKTGKLLKKPEGIQPYGYISSTDLVLTVNHFYSTNGGIQLDDIYASFEWKSNAKGGPDGINKDNIAITVPEGYEIQTNMYAGAAQRYAVYLNYSEWTNPDSALITNQYPVKTSLYGAAWEFSGEKASIPFSKYKGTVKLSMKKINANAMKRVVIQYSEAVQNVFGNYSVSISFPYALSVSFSPGSGSNNTLDKDYNW